MAECRCIHDIAGREWRQLDHVAHNALTPTSSRFTRYARRYLLNGVQCTGQVINLTRCAAIYRSPETPEQPACNPRHRFVTGQLFHESAAQSVARCLNNPCILRPLSVPLDRRPCDPKGLCGLLLGRPACDERHEL